MPSDRFNPWARFRREVRVAPSLLACDYVRLGEQIRAVESAGAEVLHVDVMDGHFVPNLALSPGIVRSVRPFTDRLLDVHLMVTDPLAFVEPFVQAGADSITFHVEADSDPDDVIRRLRTLGAGVGIVLKPATPPETIAPFVGRVDLVLIMTVEPGFGGQEFMSEQVEKIRIVRALFGQDVRVEVDGGINPQTGAQCVRAGADTLVAGADIFRAPDVRQAYDDLATAGRQAAGRRA